NPRTSGATSLHLARLSGPSFFFVPDKELSDLQKPHRQRPRSIGAAFPHHNRASRVPSYLSHLAQIDPWQTHRPATVSACLSAPPPSASLSILHPVRRINVRTAMTDTRCLSTSSS